MLFDALINDYNKWQARKFMKRLNTQDAIKIMNETAPAYMAMIQDYTWNWNHEVIIDNCIKYLKELYKEVDYRFIEHQHSPWEISGKLAINFYMTVNNLKSIVLSRLYAKGFSKLYNEEVYVEGKGRGFRLFDDKNITQTTEPVVK